MRTFETLQQEVGEWSKENFGDQPSVNPLLGTGEEAGELADDIDFSSPPDEAELDAVGDILVYAADLCARRDLDYQAAYDSAQNRVPQHKDFFREWVAARGQLIHSVLKQRQGIRLDEAEVGARAEKAALERMLCALGALADDRGYTLEECIETAWYDEVIDREWDSSYTDA